MSTTSRAGSGPASTTLTDRHEPDTQISARSTILLSVRACKRRPRRSGLIKMLTNGQSSVASNQSLRPSITIAPEAPDRPHPRGFLHWRLSDDGPSARDKRVRWAVLRNPSQFPTLADRRLSARPATRSCLLSGALRPYPACQFRQKGTCTGPEVKAMEARDDHPC